MTLFDFLEASFSNVEIIYKGKAAGQYYSGNKSIIKDIFNESLLESEIDHFTAKDDKINVHIVKNKEMLYGR